MTGGQTRRSQAPVALMVMALVAVVLAAGCALTHRRAPATQELALEYSSPPLEGVHPVAAAIKIRRFSALSPYDGTAMYFQRSGYKMESFNYDRWVATPADQVSDLLYRDLAASHAFRDVFPYLSTEQARFQLEGTVVRFLMLEQGQSWRARLDVNISLIDSAAQQGDRQVVLQREFEAGEGVAGESAEQYAAGMSDAMRTLSAEIIRAAHDAAAERLDQQRKAAAAAG